MMSSSGMIVLGREQSCSRGISKIVYNDVFAWSGNEIGRPLAVAWNYDDELAKLTLCRVRLLTCH